MVQGFRAYSAGEYDSAVRYLRRSESVEGADRAWCWTYLTLAYAEKDDTANYQTALAQLRQLDSARADEIERGVSAPPEAGESE